jgi:hypothetical protein
LPKEYFRIRGNLTMPEGATREDHAKVRIAFNRSLGRHRKRDDVVIAIHATTDANPKGAHYDFVGFLTGSNKRKVMDAIRDIWKQSGGLRATVRPLKSEDVPAVVNYQNHPASQVASNKERHQLCQPDPQIDPKSDTQNVIKRDSVYLLKPVKDGGLKAYWHTGGFWRNTSMQEIWETLKSEMFPNAADQPAKAVVSNEPKPYIPGVDFERDVSRFARCLPRNPEDAIGATTYAKQWNVNVMYMLKCLRQNNRAKCLNGWRNADGYCVYNAWCYGNI